MNFPKRLPKFSSDKMTLCNNNYQTCFSDTLTSARPTLPFQAQVSTPPSGPADVNALKNMFDPYNLGDKAKTAAYNVKKSCCLW